MKDLMDDFSMLPREKWQALFKQRVLDDGSVFEQLHPPHPVQAPRPHEYSPHAIFQRGHIKEQTEVREGPISSVLRFRVPFGQV